MGGKRINLSVQISKSSVNYFILSFLPPLQVVRLGQLNKRFYNLYVPVTLQTMTVKGTQPNSGFLQRTFAIQLEMSPNLILLQIPSAQKDSLHGPRSEFWRKLRWNNEMSVFRNKRAV